MTKKSVFQTIKQTQTYSSVRKFVKKSRVHRALTMAKFRSRTKAHDIKDETFHDIDSLCLFIGHGRSGHSIVGALLDAHPNAIISDETDALSFLKAGFTKKQIYQVLLLRSAEQINRGRTKSSRSKKKYSYLVPGQWQGTFETLRIIGDSKAAVTTKALIREPKLIKTIPQFFDTQFRLIQIIRNPFDNIATMSISGRITLEQAAQNYFELWEAITEIEKHIAQTHLFRAEHEFLISNPEGFMQALCGFVGLPPHEDYVKACASIIFQSPNKTRELVEWPADLKSMVEQKIQKFAPLRAYTY